MEWSPPATATVLAPNCASRVPGMDVRQCLVRYSVQERFPRAHDNPHRPRQLRFPNPLCRCGRHDSPQIADTCPDAAVLRQSACSPERHGGSLQCPPLGPATEGVWARSTAHCCSVRAPIRQVEQERCCRRGDLGGVSVPLHALSSRQIGEPAGDTRATPDAPTTGPGPRHAA